MVEKPKGRISREHTIWCGGCAVWDQIAVPRAHAVKEWRRTGWRLTKKHGWLCGRCAKEAGRG